jgi:glycosyltransferase involved in cell wall biosynthesis
MIFSIITPSYNQLDWLRLCIASVRDQVLPPTLDSHPPDVIIEHIIQDAGTPNIGTFAQELGAEFYLEGQLIYGANDGSADGLRVNSRSTDGRFIGYSLKIFSEKDAGMYDAVNRGFKRCSGDIVCYINCDEQLLEGALEKVHNFFGKNLSCEILSAGCLIVNTEGDLETVRPGLVPSLPHILTDHLPTLTASLFYRREVIKNNWNLFDSRYKDLADMLWVIDRLNEKRRFKRAAFYTSVFTDTGGNMNLLPNARSEASYIRSKVPSYFKKLKFLFVFRHRLTKLILGCYASFTLSYSIYTKATPSTRTNFKKHGRFGVWRSRLSPSALESDQ